MLGAVKLKVAHTTEKTCFAYINTKYSSSYSQNQCVQLLCKDKQILLWAIFTSAVPEGRLACNPIFCRLVNLEEGYDVFVSPYMDGKVLDELYIDTDSPEDQEILEYNAELLQLRVLDQLRLVSANQKAIIWISGSLPIIFTSKRTGILTNNSKIIVKIDAFKSFNGFQQNTVQDVPLEDTRESSFNNIGLVNDSMLKPYLNVPKKLVLRALPIDSDGKKNLIHPYTVFLHQDYIEKDDLTILATIKQIQSAVEENEVFVEDTCVEIVPIDNIVYKSLSREMYNKCIPTLLVTKSLNSIINIQSGRKVLLTFLNKEVDQPDHIDITVYSNSEVEDVILDRFRKCVVESTHSGKKMLINNSFIKRNQFITNGYVKFELKPNNLKYTMINSESFRHCSLSAKCVKDEPEINVTKVPYDMKTYCRTLKSAESLVQDVVKHLNFEIHREACFPGASEVKSNVLVTGSNGTGKSSLCDIIAKELTVWSQIIHCRALKGRKDIPEVLSKAILTCQERSPAVVMCDDVDALIPEVIGGSPQDIAYYQRLAVVIKKLLQSCNGVAVLMTASDLKTLHPTLSEFGGRPLFTAHFKIPPLNQTDRIELFNHLLSDRLRAEFEVTDDDVIKMAANTGGSNARDITDYLNRKIFKAVKKKNMLDDDAKTALIDEIEDTKDTGQNFDVFGPIGGMDDVKQKLIESIFWPIMYPSLFPSQSCGILLYGPPGTGKSYIGSCLAKVGSINFIAVKGPELLSKYIGQSEKAVRDIFDKAEMQKPCILFFDEFDSLAPKRGHESTGVTDRVVNQLLSRLDGAEGGAGCFVVAASARPDLLDPALLRAPRLPLHLYCQPPNEDDRLSILRILARDIDISEDIDLSELSEKTIDFSAADLKSLLVTAQLTALDRKLATSGEKSLDSVIVELEDLESALEETKPSLTQEQRRFYDIIYKRFRGESLTSQEAMSTRQKQKVTLA